MHSLIAAQQQLHQKARAVSAVETVALQDALGRLLAEDIIAPRAVPPQDNSAMDGYAVSCAHLDEQMVWPVSQRVCAGQMPVALARGTVAQIFTGAPIPAGADAVVMQEQVSRHSDGQVSFTQPVRVGQNIRRAGEDMQPGQTILTAGTPLRAASLGLLAALGLAKVTVKRRLRVAVFFTGDELIEPGQAWQNGKIYNANRYWLVAALHTLGCVVHNAGIIPDQLAATRQALRQAATDADVVMTCGGVSVGEEDHVKAAVAAEGQLDLWKVAIKPGKPLAYGQVGAAHFIGLPGNPVSAYVTFMMLVRDFLRHCAGEVFEPVLPLWLPACFAWPRPDMKRTEFLRGRMHAQGVDIFPHQGSGVLTSCAWADVLVALAPAEVVTPGQLVAVYRLL